MGRAIDMEKDINQMKIRLEKVERTLNGMAYTLDEIEEKSSKTKHVDIIKETKKEVTNEEKKTNNEGNGKSSGKSNRGNKKNKS